MDITPANYYTREADLAYFGYSQIKAYLKCPSAWWHKYVVGDYHPEVGDALLAGQYVDIALLEPDTLDAWIAEHREFVYGKTNKGKLKRIEDLDDMIAAVRRQPVLMDYLTGDRQTIVTATVEGHPVKARLDVYDPARRRIVDLKTTASIVRTEWHDELRTKVDFIENYDYWLQAALYQKVVYEATGIECDSYIVAVSKEDTPDVALYTLGDEDRLHWALYGTPWVRDVASMLGAVSAMDQMHEAKADGQEPDGRCWTCEWCRKTKVVTHPLPAVNYWKPYLDKVGALNPTLYGEG